MNLPKPKKINTQNYEAGLSSFRKRISKIKISANESALGPSPKAIREYIRTSKNIKRYPENQSFFLQKILAKKFKLDFKRIIIGSGSDQIFELICRAFLKKNDEVIVPQYSFIIYRIYSKICGAKVIYAKEKNFRISVDSILSKVSKRTKIVFLANPNNPTGTIIFKNELLKLRKKLRRNILLVVDDAYYEYVRNKNFSSGLDLFSKSKNVIITRTFSKIFGLAGLRIGWGYGPKVLIEALNNIKPPFNVNKAAISAASVAIKDKKWLSKEIQHVSKWSNIFLKIFKNLKIETNKSYANFLLISFNKIKRNSKKIFLNLASSGIIVREMSVYNIKNCLRVSIGSSIENKKFIYKLKKIINV